MRDRGMSLARRRRRAGNAVGDAEDRMTTIEDLLADPVRTTLHLLAGIDAAKPIRLGKVVGIRVPYGVLEQMPAALDQVRVLRQAARAVLAASLTGALNHAEEAVAA